MKSPHNAVAGSLSGAKNSPTPPSPRAWLEVCRGRTAFPRREILVGAFTIGADAGCQLRLGGRDMPARHSIVRQVGSQLEIEVLAREPKLKVNGEVCRRSVLNEGDVLEIGPFSFNVRLPGPEALSAAELVDRLEAEQRMVDEFEAGSRAGAAALLAAVEQRAAQIERRRTTDEELVEDLTAAADLIEQFTGELRRESELMSDRQMGIDRAAEDLLGAQDQLAKQVESLWRRLKATEVEEKPPVRRAA
ncbi:MAG: FHA domain-containing protein [Planctomycetes bacterium]|nr:FHA domain-containing protein [Planctomycetota bacterium]